MKKLIVLFLTVLLAIGCSSDFNPSMSRGGGGGGASFITTNDNIFPDIIVTNDNAPSDDIITNNNNNNVSSSEGKLSAFINRYAGVYYTAGMIEGDIRGQVVQYKLKDGKIWSVNEYNQATDILQHPTETVILSDTQLLIDNYIKGTKEILQFTSKGLDAYINFFLDKVSDTADTQGMYLIGVANGYGKYAGTYRSQYEKKDKYLSITADGSVYFYEYPGSRSLFPGNDGKQLLIIDSKGVRNTMLFDGSIYRKYTLKNNKITNITYPMFFEVTKDFIEDINGGQFSKYESDNGRDTICFNEPIGSSGIVKMTGSVCIGRTKAGYPSVMAADITILKGKTLIIGGENDKYVKERITGTFSADWSTLTYKNGVVLKRKN